MRICELIESRSSDEILIYPNGEGADITTHSGYERDKIDVPIRDAIGNEPRKDLGYLRSEKLYMDKMINHIRKGGKLKPVVGIRHPANKAKTLIIDGNHRLIAYKQAGSKFIPVHFVPHEKVFLLIKPSSWTNNKFVPLIEFRNKDGSYDMYKMRIELGRRTLSSYFARI